MLNRTARGLLVGILAAAVSCAAFALRFTQPLEWKSWDLRLRLFSDPGRASQDIAIFLIDQYSLDVYKKQHGLSWPWPRQMYSIIIDFLKKGGAKACFIDLAMSEPSVYGVEDDQILAAAMASAGNVFLPLALSQREDEAETVSIDILKRFQLRPEDFPREYHVPAKSAGLPLDVLLNAARGTGNILFTPDGDGIFRRLPLLFTHQGLILPSIPLAVAGFIRGDKGPWKIPFDKSGQLVVRYYGPTGTYRTYSIASIINSWALIEDNKEPQIPAEEFAGKVVLVGGSAPGLLDLRPTPLSPVTPGVEVHANVIDNLLQEDFIRISSPVVSVIFVLLTALFVGIGTSLLKRMWLMGVFLVVSLFVPAVVCGLAFKSGYWLEFVAPELAAVSAFIGASLLNYNVEGRQRRFIKNVFRHYLSPQVIEKIIEDPSLLRLGGENREVTSYFSDVAGFTALSESLTPEKLVGLLNAFLSEMTDIILGSGGTLDKYEGDAIIAFWNAPLDQPDHALRGCRAALECQRRLAELRPEFLRGYGHEIFMRVGLNSGPAVVGNMGSRRRFDYTAMGDTINLASRLEGVCKHYQVPVLVGERTYESVKDAILGRKVDIIRVVGKKKPVSVYEIIGEEGKVEAGQLSRIRRFDEALSGYENGQWEAARELFLRIEEDPLSMMYANRCLRLLQSPPPPDWDGVFELKEK